MLHSNKFIFLSKGSVFIRNNVFKSGFTLLEVMVIVSVIAILTAVVGVQYSKIQATARDSLRVSDLEQIQLALVQYKQIHGDYPDASYNDTICSKVGVCSGPNYISEAIKDVGGLEVADLYHDGGVFTYQYQYDRTCVSGSFTVTTLSARMETEGKANQSEIEDRCSDIGGDSNDHIIILEFREL